MIGCRRGVRGRGPSHACRSSQSVRVLVRATKVSRIFDDVQGMVSVGKGRLRNGGERRGGGGGAEEGAYHMSVL